MKFRARYRTGWEVVAGEHIDLGYNPVTETWDEVFIVGDRRIEVALSLPCSYAPVRPSLAHERRWEFAQVVLDSVGVDPQTILDPYLC